MSHHHNVGPFLTGILSSVFLLTAFTSPASAQLIEESDRILPPDPVPGGTFGNRITIEGEWMAVGADHDSDILAPGRVDLYRRDGGDWIHTQALTAPDGFDGDHFGLPVTIRDDRLLIGMPWDDDAGNRAGAAHVFTLQDGSWEWLQKLTPQGIDDTGALFGSTCVFGRDSGEIMVGAFLESIESNTEGGLWVFQEEDEEYRLAQRLSLPGEQPAAYFGRSIDVENGILAVGAPGFLGPLGFRHGGVAFHSIRNDSWQLDGILLPDVPIQYQVFGESIDLDGDLLAVGSPFEDTFGESAGAVHVYRISNGIPDLEATLRSNEPSRGFGFPVNFDARGGRIVIGAYASSLDGTREGGAAWVHERIEGGWTSGTRLRHARSMDSDFFGLSGTFDGDRVLVGIPRHDGTGEDTGAIAIFDLQDCDDSGLLDVWEIASGGLGDQDGDGVPDSCDLLDGDFNADGVVDGLDLGIFSGLWGTDGSMGGDLNGDGIVDGGDVALLLSDWSA
ncbi:MAG: hypothetical protein CMJ51_04635 [Planctomycetaceae bacterium]|nr:hypothetical protein [Planctomycetaceae bacterium]